MGKILNLTKKKFKNNLKKVKKVKLILLLKKVSNG